MSACVQKYPLIRGGHFSGAHACYAPEQKPPRTACGFAWHGRRVTVPHKSIPIELARRCVGALGRNTNHQLYTSAGWVRTNAYI